MKKATNSHCLENIEFCVSLKVRSTITCLSSRVVLSETQSDRVILDCSKMLSGCISDITAPVKIKHTNRGSMFILNTRVLRKILVLF